MVLSSPSRNVRVVQGWCPPLFEFQGGPVSLVLSPARYGFSTRCRKNLRTHLGGRMKMKTYRAGSAPFQSGCGFHVHDRSVGP